MKTRDRGMTYDDARAMLAAAGYREYHGSRLSNEDTLFQRRVEFRAHDRSVTRYFINASLWDWSRYPHTSATHPCGIQWDVAFYRGELHVRAMLPDVWEVGTAEAFFDEMYERMGMEPDRHNQRD